MLGTFRNPDARNLRVVCVGDIARRIQTMLGNKPDNRGEGRFGADTAARFYIFFFRDRCLTAGRVNCRDENVRVPNNRAPGGFRTR